MLEALKKQVDFKESNQYTLSIRLCTDGFSFSLYNPLKNEHPLVYRNIEVDKHVSMFVNLQRFLKITGLEKYTYKAVNFIFVSKRYTLIPQNYYDNKEGAEQHFKFNHLELENEIIICNPLPLANLNVTHGIHEDIVQTIKDAFPNAKLYSQITPLIEYLTSKSKTGNRKKMYINYRATSFDLCCFNRGHLLLANTIQFDTLEDQIYYLLYIWKQHEFNQLEDEMHVMGAIPHKEELSEKLKKYIKKVFIVHPKAEFIGNSDTNSELPFDLQTILLCEL